MGKGEEARGSKKPEAGIESLASLVPVHRHLVTSLRSGLGSAYR